MKGLKMHFCSEPNTADGALAGCLIPAGFSIPAPPTEGETQGDPLETLWGLAAAWHLPCPPCGLGTAGEATLAQLD